MKRNDSFLIFCGIAIILILIVFGIKIVTRETKASFGGITGSFGNSTKVIYNSNFPNDEFEDKSYEYEGANSYKILSNMFDVPSGYEFTGWGVFSTGPVLYNENQYIEVSADLTLYAIWDEIIRYGDVNLNGVIDELDYDLIDKYILDNSIISGQGLINADVNVDGKIDIVDLDIIKQVCLGTEEYVGYLPDKPILIYQLYEKNDDIDINGDLNNGNRPSTGVTGGGIGSGNAGTGTGSLNNNGGSKPGNSTGSSNSNNKPSLNNGEDKEEEIINKYSFVFMNGELEYARTECLVLEDKTCMLVLPNTIPAKKGSNFNGWSMDLDCSKEILKEAVSVSSNNTYYACFSNIIEVSSEDKNSLSEWIIVIIIWILAIFGIYRVVDNYNKKSN